MITKYTKTIKTFGTLGLVGTVFFLGGCSEELVLPEGTNAYTIEQVKESEKVIVEEFSDVQCPACRAFAPIYEQVAKDMPEVEFRYYHFPLEQIHDYAYAGAISVECAGLIAGEKVRDEYLSKVMITELKSIDVFREIASEIGLETDRFNTCLDNKETKDIVKNHTKEATTRGVGSTPTIFIDGEKLEGGRSETELKKRIEAVIAKKTGTTNDTEPSGITSEVTEGE